MYYQLSLPINVIKIVPGTFKIIIHSSKTPKKKLSYMGAFLYRNGQQEQGLLLMEWIRSGDTVTVT